MRSFRMCVRYFASLVLKGGVQRSSIVIPKDRLAEEPYASVICYPRSSPDEIRKRMDELRILGVDAIEFSGTTPALSLPVLGKGYMGVVVIVHVNGERMALKVLRTDSIRENMDHESKMLAMANTVKVGPRLTASTEHFILMQLIGGSEIEDWLSSENDGIAVRDVLKNVLEQCFRLDEISLDHGELRRAPKHILVDDDNVPYMVDFETASTHRNASNVTSICHFLFKSDGISKKLIDSVLGERDWDKMIPVLKRYREQRDRGSFGELLEMCLSVR